MHVLAASLRMGFAMSGKEALDWQIGNSSWDHKFHRSLVSTKVTVCWIDTVIMRSFQHQMLCLTCWKEFTDVSNYARMQEKQTGPKMNHFTKYCNNAIHYCQQNYDFCG